MFDEDGPSFADCEDDVDGSAEGSSFIGPSNFLLPMSTFFVPSRKAVGFLSSRGFLPPNEKVILVSSLRISSWGSFFPTSWSPCFSRSLKIWNFLNFYFQIKPFDLSLQMLLHALLVILLLLCLLLHFLSADFLFLVNVLDVPSLKKCSIINFKNKTFLILVNFAFAGFAKVEDEAGKCVPNGGVHVDVTLVFDLT